MTDMPRRRLSPHLLDDLVPVALGISYTTAQEIEFRAELAPLRRYFDKFLNEREGKFVVAYFRNTRDAVSAAREVPLLRLTGEDAKGDPDGSRYPTHTQFEWERAARHVLRRAHVQAIIRALTQLCGTDRLYRPTLRAAALAAVEGAVTTREVTEALKVALPLFPELRARIDQDDPAQSLRTADRLLADFKVSRVLSPHGDYVADATPRE